MRYYDKLFTLCGYEPNELKDDRQRIERALHILELTPEDMNHAFSFVNKYHDVSLLGVRKLLGAWLKELIDLVLAKEEGKKVVYFEFPAIFGPTWLLKYSSDDVYAASPDVIFCSTLGHIFDKQAPIFEAGEQHGIPPGHGICTLWTHKIGALAKNYIPVPDVVMASSYMCDVGSKGSDMLSELYGVEVAHIDSCPDYEWNRYPDFTREKVSFFGGEINKAFDLIEKTIDIKVREDGLEKSMGTINEFLELFGQLGALNAHTPQPISTVALNLCQPFIVASTGRCVTYGIEAMKILIEETRQRVENGIGVVAKDAPRVILFIHSHSDPRIAKMMEEYMAIPANFIAFYPIIQPKDSKLDITEYNTIGEKIAAMEMVNGLFHSGYSVVKKFEMIISHLRENLDGAIYSILYHCRPAALGSHTMKKFIEEKQNLPLLQLELDLWDHRFHNAESMRVRIETFAAMLKQKKRR